MGDLISPFLYFFTHPYFQEKNKAASLCPCVVSCMLTIREKEVYCWSLQPPWKRRAKVRDFMSKLEKWSSFPSHPHPSPQDPWVPFLNPSIPGCIPPFGLLVCSDILCGASFSLLIFPLLLKGMTWLHFSCWNPVLGVWSLGRDQEWKEKREAFLTTPKYHPQHWRTKQGMLSRAVLLANGKQIRAFGPSLGSRI